MKRHNIITAFFMAIFTALFLGVIRAFAPRGVDALNVAGTHDDAYTRIAEGAISPHLVLKAGTDPATQVAPCDATSVPIGTAYDEAADGEDVAVELPTGKTRLCIASKAITAGSIVSCTAAGKVTDATVVGSYTFGRAVTSGAADGDEIEVLPLTPVQN